MFAAKDTLLTKPSGGYRISRSVRLRSSASAYFNRTLTTPTSSQKFTWSGWTKRGKLDSSGLQGIFCPYSSGTVYGYLAWYQDGIRIFDRLSGGTNYLLQTTAVYRDPSAWYHIVYAVDTTQATAANRVRLYVNGVEVTSFSTSTYPTQNNSTTTNSAIAHNIGYDPSNVGYFDGYLTETNFIDGQALTPSSFGETNSITGVWQPKKYGGTYGTNGFYLNFSDNSGATATTIGKDYSGNGNNWTPNNISVTAGVTYDSMLDVPTVGSLSSNYCVLNSLNQNSAITLSAGNLSFTASNNRFTTGTFAVTSGKWYWEFYPVAGGASGAGVGAILATTYVFGTAGFANGAGYIGVGYTSNGSKYISGTSSAYGATYGSGNVIGVALDLDSGTKTITFYKDNTSQGSINLPTSSEAWIVATDYSEAGTHSINFGQRPFTYTPPTNFVALNTQNLPTPTISNGANYMAATLYTGTGAGLTISNAVNGISFQPDWVWIKVRTTTYDHNLYDSLRGTSMLASNLNLAENPSGSPGDLTTYNAGGFSIQQTGNYELSHNGDTYVAWQWNAGGSTVTNTSGSISAQVRANATAGFSVVTWTGNGTNGATVGHGLGVAPKMVIVKRRSATENWGVYHASLPSAAYYLVLNTTVAQDSGGATIWNSTAPTSTLLTLGTSTYSNANTSTYVAYCFAAVAGYSAFGSYTGNGSTDGPFVFLGFRPRFIVYKVATGTTGNWKMHDTSRGTYNADSPELLAESSAAEGASSGLFDLLSNGFKLRTTSSNYNGSGNTYIYMAFAENPFKNSLAR